MVRTLTQSKLNTLRDAQQDSRSALFQSRQASNVGLLGLFLREPDWESNLSKAALLLSEYLQDSIRRWEQQRGPTPNVHSLILYSAYSHISRNQMAMGGILEAICEGVGASESSQWRPCIGGVELVCLVAGRDDLAQSVRVATTDWDRAECGSWELSAIPGFLDSLDGTPELIQAQIDRATNLAVGRIRERRDLPFSATVYNMSLAVQSRHDLTMLPSMSPERLIAAFPPLVGLGDVLSIELSDAVPNPNTHDVKDAIMRGNPEKARRIARAILDDSDNSAFHEATVILAGFDFVDGNPAHSLERLEKYLQRYPGDWVAWSVLASALDALGLQSDSQDAKRKSKEEAPDGLVELAGLAAADEFRGNLAFGWNGSEWECRRIRKGD